MNGGIDLLIGWARWLAVVAVLLSLAAAAIAFVRPLRRPRPTYRARANKRYERGSIRSWRKAA